ncbi:Uncharacterised protein [Legionella beliardensis]|uniref:Uncharacterized protein n=1 Tax=Legionella beliardensis TaxID=91822 RepID=A0A378I3N1_9GAMM|nr:hypothetical protein [Legionella beliardensis]STX29797.1 Uncharacterised protein [Legionella beliardensis]
MSKAKVSISKPVVVSGADDLMAQTVFVPTSKVKPPKNSYPLEDTSGYHNYVTGVDEKNGIYTIKGQTYAGVARSITINPKTGTVTDQDGQEDTKKFGNVCKRMLEEQVQIFHHFKVKPLTPIAQTGTYHTNLSKGVSSGADLMAQTVFVPTSKVKPPKNSYPLEDTSGYHNYVTGVDEKNGIYTIKGQTYAGVARSITINPKTGTVTDQDGQEDTKKFGNVCKRMLEEQVQIFHHFKVKYPTPIAQTGTYHTNLSKGVSSGADLMAQTVFVPTSKVKPPKNSYPLEDTSGYHNYVTGVDEKNGIYTIKGQTYAGVARSITINPKTGTVTDQDGQEDTKKFGNVCKRMLEEQVQIFHHFKVKHPTSKLQESNSLKGGESGVTQKFKQSLVDTKGKAELITGVDTEKLMNDFLERFKTSLEKSKILCFTPSSQFMEKYNKAIKSNQPFTINDLLDHIKTREGKNSRSREILETLIGKGNLQSLLKNEPVDLSDYNKASDNSFKI